MESLNILPWPWPQKIASHVGNHHKNDLVPIFEIWRNVRAMSYSNIRLLIDGSGNLASPLGFVKENKLSSKNEN